MAERGGFEGDAVADAVSGGCSPCGGGGDGVGIEGGDDVVRVGEGERDGQRTFTAADDCDAPTRRLRHRVLLGLAGDIERVERVAGDLVDFEVDEPGVGEHLERELFAPCGAEPSAPFGQ